MTEELENKLYQLDPIFFEEAIACLRGEMNEMNTCMAFGCECGDGWFKPIELLAKKTSILNELGKQYNIKFVCNQLKEKFGEIRIYTSINKINPVEEFKPGWDVLDKMFHDSKSKCEIECSNICEICGADGGYNNENIVQTSGWIRYICKKCAREQTENSTKCYDENHKDNEFCGIDRITLFKQENMFLNLYHSRWFKFNNESYMSIPHAYFSIKNPEYKEIYNAIADTQNGFAPCIIEELGKKNGIKIDDFELLKEIVFSKFSDKWNESIKQDLLLTNNKMLIYMNNLHNNILGYCYCDKCKDIEKQNIYGKILMDVRNEIQKGFVTPFNSLEEAKEFCNNINIKLNIFSAINKKVACMKKFFVTNKNELQIEEWNFEVLK